MIKENALVLYKTHPALVDGFEGDKINITLLIAGKKGITQKVRDKDIELLHPGPCRASLGGEFSRSDLCFAHSTASVRETWELLIDNEGEELSLKDLAEILFSDFTPSTVWTAWELLKEGIYFSGDLTSIKARPKEQVEEDERKRDLKQKENDDRAAFLEKVKNFKPGQNYIADESDRRFIQDIEALAKGQSDKSRTLKELGKTESPEEAHRLLLALGLWTIYYNPHPERNGFNLKVEAGGQSELSSTGDPVNAAGSERKDLTHLASYAIDSPWSDDPDDAISLEGPHPDGSYTLWVHAADPSCVVSPGSPLDVEAMGRGSSLYLPEGRVSMLPPSLIHKFRLGDTWDESGSGTFPAMSFKLTITPKLTVSNVEIFLSNVNIRRITYEHADELIAGAKEGSKDEAGIVLAALASLSEKNVERRLDTGAVVIEMPEVHINVGAEKEDHKREISIEPMENYRSNLLIRECMIWAGEGAARWALSNKLPFPYISQEAGELPETRLPHLAGAWQLRRSMRGRTLSVKPGIHWGLGLDEYTQVTSPMRRYTDLLCHQQIRALLQNEKPMDEDTLAQRLAAADAAMARVARADRASKVFWKAVYLHDKKDSVWDGIVLDRKGNKGVVMIPSLGMEAHLNLRGNEEANSKVKLKVLSTNIIDGEVIFALS